MEATTLSAAARAADLRAVCGPRFDTFTVRTDEVGDDAGRFFRPAGDERSAGDEEGDRWDGLA